MGKKYYQGRFKPENPEKYIGDSTDIIWRSSWELKVMRYFDKHPSVKRWGSEEIVIPYKSPIDNKYHRYFTDFVVETINTKGEKKISVIEVKPKKETRPPVKKSKVTKRYLNEVKTWGVNQSKWEAAKKYCDERGYEFLILTEDDLGI